MQKVIYIFSFIFCLGEALYGQSDSTQQVVKSGNSSKAPHIWGIYSFQEDTLATLHFHPEFLKKITLNYHQLSIL